MDGWVGGVDEWASGIMEDEWVGGCVDRCMNACMHGGRYRAGEGYVRLSVFLSPSLHVCGLC